MTKCSECEIKMGYAEANASKDHDGMCVGCYVKSLVKGQMEQKSPKRQPSNVKSIDGLFAKFEQILVTTETAPNLKIRKRLGVVHGEASQTSAPHQHVGFIKKILRRNAKPSAYHASFRKTVEEADIELKANAIKMGANCVIGYNMQLTGAHLGNKDYLIVCVTGTAVEIA
jgi:uncharacterized protein YbjQ (UPF0145 family)